MFQKEEKVSRDEKMANFTEIALRIINDPTPNDGDIGGIPTLDFIGELNQEDKINSNQYQALLELYSNPQKVSEDNVVALINSQFYLSQSIEDIDELKEKVFLTPDYVTVRRKRFR